VIEREDLLDKGIGEGNVGRHHLVQEVRAGGRGLAVLAA